MTGLMTAACAAVLLAPASAAAAPQKEPQSHCVVDTATRKTTCYDTFRESIAAATGGRINNASQEEAAKDKHFLDKLNASAKAPAGTQSSRTSASAASPFVLSIFYDDWDYEGSSLTSTGNAACKNDGKWDYQQNYIESGWNNHVTSLKLFSNCYVELFSGANFTEARQFFTSDTRWVGEAMDNQASSVAWT
ncbi:hypothetical protein [Streptomyces sp. ML-6]|uniref:hypothetical protein n=1 Tax=Streptomyces sp. ML-6 TaxID=2982693 RepID=UPI0024C09967|nr:hypothetical protein [Streptomyces sp. ML-6]MDK0524569.1 hypothetical protein [Streptomyces sp. ML-6]